VSSFAICSSEIQDLRWWALTYALLQVWVNPLSHTSDTMVDEERVEGKILLKDNDLIEIGQRKFIFHSLNPEAGSGSAKVQADEHAGQVPLSRLCFVASFKQS
jgi:hypothetical protein